MSQQRILIFRLGAIGDVAMATTAVHYLRKTYPKSRITFMVGKVSAPVLERNELLDDIWQVDEQRFYGRQRIFLWRLWLRILSKRFDDIFILNKDTRYYWFFKSIPGARVHAPSSIDTSVFQLRQHMVESYLLICGAKQVAPQDYYPLHMTSQLEDVPAAIQQAMAAQPKQHKCIVLNPGGGANPGEVTDVKRWPTVHYCELAQRLHQHFKEHVYFIITGGPSDKKLGQEIESYLQTKGITGIDVTGQTSLAGYRQITTMVDCVITGDTGGMHLAATSDVPLVALFGPTDPEVLTPLTDNTHVIWSKLDCAPCYHGQFSGCILEKPICMQQVSIERVFAVVKRVLIA